MRALGGTGRARAVIGAGALALALVPPIAVMAGEPFAISLVTRILIYALAAVSLDLILGFGAMVSFGHAAFFGVGAYVAGVLAFHASEGGTVPGLPWITGTEEALLAWPAAAVVAGVVAALVGSLSLRTTGIHFIMITLAFAQMLFFFFVSLETYGGDDGLSLYGRNHLPGADLADDTTFYYVCFALLAGFVYLCRRVVRSRFGMVVRGAAQNERRLRALGVPTFRYRLACFTLAGAGAGLAGALIANQTEFVSPALLHWTRSGELLVMVILGGMGTLFGPIVGALTLLVLEEVIAMYTEHWMVFIGPFLVLVVLFSRRGIYGLLAGAGRDDG